MNPKTTVYLSIAVLLGLAGVWFANSSKPVAGPPPGPKSLFDPKPEGVKRLELAAWGKPAMVFEKSDEKWRIVEPIKAPAETFAVDGAVNRLLDMQVERAYAEGASDRPGEDMTKMQQPTWLAKITDKDGRTQTMRVGGPVLLARQTFVQVEGDKKLYVVKGELATEIQGGLETYRDKRVVDFIANDVVRVELSGAARLTLAKTDGKWTVESPVKARASAKDVTQMLVSLSNARAEKFVEDAPSNVRVYGLDKPRLTVTLNVEHEKKVDRPDPMKVLATQPATTIEKRVVTLHFGTLNEEKVFARLGDAERPWVFTMPKHAYEAVVNGAEKVRDKQVIAGDPLRATLMRITGPGGSVSLEKKDGTWRMSAGAGEADFAAVDDLLKGLAGLTATAFEDGNGLTPDYGFESGTKIELQIEGNLEAMGVTIGGPTRGGTGAYVRNDREGTVFVVKAETAEAMRVTPLAFVDRKLLSFERGHVNQIEIEHEGMTRTLTKRGFNWEMTSPANKPVEMKVVLDLLTDVSALSARNIVGTQSELAKFGLDQPLVRARFIVQPPAPIPPPSTSSAPASAPAAPPPVTYSVVAGRQAGKAYLFVEGGARIAEVDDKVLRDLTAEPAEHKVTKLDLSKLSGIELTYPDRSMSLRKKGLEWLLEGEPGFRGDDAKIMAMANAVRDMATDRYVAYAGADLKTYKLDAPAIRVGVHVEGAPLTELLISSEGPAGDEAKRRYATVGNSGAVFLVAASEAGKFEKQMKELQLVEGAVSPPPPMMPDMGE